jgi:hypothetical protein
VGSRQWAATLPGRLTQNPKLAKPLSPLDQRLRADGSGSGESRKLNPQLPSVAVRCMLTIGQELKTEILVKNPISMEARCDPVS